MFEYIFYGTLAAIFVKECINASAYSTGHIFVVTVDLLLSGLIWRKPGITISSMAAIAAQNGKRWGKSVQYVLNKLEKNHCALAVQGDIERAQAAITYLGTFKQPEA